MTQKVVGTCGSSFCTYSPKRGQGLRSLLDTMGEKKGKEKTKTLCDMLANLSENNNSKTRKKQDTRNCKEREVIYAPQRFKLKVLYIRHTGEQLLRRFFKHHYDIKNRQDNSKTAKFSRQMTI